MDILHPLATLHWERKLDTQGQGRGRVVRCGDMLYLHNIEANSIRCAPVTDLTSWTTLPTQLDMYDFSLTTYQSQLVLAGGVRGESILNEVWVSADGTNWQKSLPPMPTSRQKATAVNTSRPECLVVAGGYGGRAGETHLLFTADVLVDGQWASTQTIPMWPHRGTLHKGRLYFSTGDKLVGYHCKVESLVGGGGGGDGKWTRMILPRTHPYQCTLISLGEWLLAFPTIVNRFPNRFLPVHAYSPLSKSWVRVGEVKSLISVVAISLGEMAVTDASGVCTARLQGLSPSCNLALIDNQSLAVIYCLVSPYDPDSRFSRSALTKLEAAGKPVVTSLERVWERLAAIIEAGHSSGHPSSYDGLLEQWVSEWTSVPPTWRSLYGMLRQLGLEGLAGEIEDYLSCPRSLREQCTSVIMSALPQQRSLEPDQLHTTLPDYDATLPDYVPTTLKQQLRDTWRLLLAPPPSPFL